MSADLHPTGVEATLGRIETGLAGLTTKADVAAFAGRIVALDARLGKVETAINDTLRPAIGRMIGPWQLPCLLLAGGMVAIALMGALNLLAHQPWFSR